MNGSFSSTTRLNILKRILSLLIVATVIGCIFKFASSRMHETSEPAGFFQGMLHGAMMPMAMPNLVIGSDVTIYAPINTGRTYKLGYTVGVNGCGALFFGFLFLRLSRWNGSRRGQS
jgi:hypothetical protein